MSGDIFNEVNEHYFKSGKKFEYGRPDHSFNNNSPNHRSDRSRTEQDLDGDGRLGVDCSSFVWRGLKDAGYNVGNEPFATSKLFNGTHPTDYSKSHFDIVSAQDAAKPNGSLQPGDILMFKDIHGSGQHVGIFKGYDKAGHVQFVGSQVSTGPAEVTVVNDGYWNRKPGSTAPGVEIVGALRAKPEFRVAEPLHGRTHGEPAVHPVAPPKAAAEPVAKSAPEAHHTTPARHDVKHDAAPHMLRKGEHGENVRDLQHSLAKLGYTDANGHAIKADAQFGAHTQEALEKFQKSHGLEVDGVAGPKTMDALHKQMATPRVDQPAHPDHKLFEQARDAVHRLDAEHKRSPDQHSDNLAAALTVAARREGMHRVDHAVLNDDATRAFAVQGHLDSPLKRIAEVETQKAVATPIEKSTEALQQVAAQPTQGKVAPHEQPMPTPQQTGHTPGL
ncbi:hypothetical protein FHW69_001716 [Luteibacter sp. Sphag1AF]|uniref:XVIPCD domain-containing protein n=1 Tax=Luteibacter sp. Sphag1AF TaxID=2587031 RepID=UPI00162168E8|nr:XVIPCD domain-containing protein [Luteibacter sp. Sphag1AF]MBB3227115.1 hypothetical protein [Luteibacter sp. Sphag1AF]